MAYDSHHKTVSCPECGASHTDSASIDHYSRCSKFNKNQYSSNQRLSNEDIEKIAKRITQILGK